MPGFNFFQQNRDEQSDSFKFAGREEKSNSFKFTRFNSNQAYSPKRNETSPVRPPRGLYEIQEGDIHNLHEENEI
jgi:hypothetical protein